MTTSAPLTYSPAQAMDIIRSRTASADMLEAALAAIDPAVAEAEVERLEVERRKLLLANAADSAIDFAEEKIKVACRALERWTAAKETLPARIVERRALEQSVNARADRAEQLAQTHLATLAELHVHASKLTELLATLRGVEGEIRATNYDLSDLGSYRSIATPLDLLERHLGCGSGDVPRVDRWPALDGYGTGNRRYTLERAAELVAQQDPPPPDPAPPAPPRRARSAPSRPTPPPAADISAGVAA